MTATSGSNFCYGFLVPSVTVCLCFIVAQRWSVKNYMKQLRMPCRRHHMHAGNKKSQIVSFPFKAHSQAYLVGFPFPFSPDRMLRLNIASDLPVLAIVAILLSVL